MRLLHTSDWHLGQTLGNYDRVYEHQCFLTWLLNTLESEQPDALLIAGDIFDHANPAAESLNQFYQFLTAANSRLPKLAIIIIAGNHDSPGRLTAPTPLFHAFNVTVSGFVIRNDDGVIQLQHLITPIKNQDGEIAIHCLSIPFLRPSDVPHLKIEGNPYLEGVKLLYHQVLEYALQIRETGQAIIALGHCHMNGGQVSADSERRIIIGGMDALPVEMFDAQLAYVALGHLHRPQQVGGQDRIRYCGSPIPMSFTEMNYRHQILRVDLGQPGAPATISEIPIPRAVELLRIPAQPAPLNEVLDRLAALDLPITPKKAQPYLQVRVQLRGPEPELNARIDTALHGKPVRLAKIESTHSDHGQAAEITGPQSFDDLVQIQADDLFKKLHWRKYGVEPHGELLNAFAELLLGSEVGR